MNEQIAELKSQCIVREQRGTNAFDSYMVDRFDTERFAELIVAECVGIVENLSPGYKDYRDQIEDAFRRDCVIEIKKHFGVEE
jgi:hypothetical protein